MNEQNEPNKDQQAHDEELMLEGIPVRLKPIYRALDQEEFRSYEEVIEVMKQQAPPGTDERMFNPANVSTYMSTLRSLSLIETSKTLREVKSGHSRNIALFRRAPLDESISQHIFNEEAGRQLYKECPTHIKCLWMTGGHKTPNHFGSHDY